MRRGMKWLRLALGGAALGVAIAGPLASLFGLEDRGVADALGAVVGGATSALLVKLAHVV
jgi:hypothetical protein